MQNLELRSALVAILAVAFIGIESNSDMLRNVRDVLYLTIKPIVEVAQVPVAVNKVIQRHFVGREMLRQRISTIAQENAELRDRVNELEYQELRNKWLADLLEVREQTEYPVLTANLVSVQLMPMSHKIVLDRGSQQQAYVGQPVLDARGLIGQVTETTRTDSAVTLITDSSHSVPVRLQRNGLLAIAHGLGLRNQLLISGLRLNQDVEVGDILITSGLGNRFPAGHPVAEITRVEGDPNSSFAEIIAAPLATIDPDFEVLMVWNNDGDSLDSISTLTLNENLELQQ